MEMDTFFASSKDIFEAQPDSKREINPIKKTGLNVLRLIILKRLDWLLPVVPVEICLLSGILMGT